MKRVLLVTAALVAAVAVFTLVSLPPARRVLDVPWMDGSLPGALHVHTTRSDGSGAPEAVARAAARAGLAFVVLTDHGDATRKPDAPAYVNGVLVIDAVEVSTSGGHVLALGLLEAPYPLGGEARDVVEDVRRLGGFSVAAHPDSPKDDLSWQDWTVPVDGVEVLNPDTAWRVRLNSGARARFALFGAVVSYPWRSSETMASLLTNSSEAVGHWDRLGDARAIVGLPGADAHAKLSLKSREPGDNSLSLEIPGYETSFRALSARVTPTAPLTGSAEIDAERILSGIRRGHVYAAVDGWAAPPAFEFTASNRRGTAAPGDELAVAGPVSLHIRTNAPAEFPATVFRNGQAIATDRHERDFTLEQDEAPASYRVEVRAPGHPDWPAWITSNPIYIRGRASAAAAPAQAATSRGPADQRSLFDQKTTIGWTHENDPTLLVAMEIVPAGAGTAELRVRYGLSGGAETGQFAGAAVDTPNGVANFDHVAFTVRAEHPMRISVQARAQFEGRPPERWQRSVYVDDTDRERVVVFGDMTPVGQTLAPRVPAEAVRSLMFIVDTVNTSPGASGRLWLKNLRLER